jgi:hypothetical protein
MTLNGGEITTTAELDWVTSATEVAVIVILRVAETEDGALNVAALAVGLAKVPQSVPLTPAPEALQVTPLPLKSFSTVAVKFTACP